jgi:hypothetical protein
MFNGIRWSSTRYHAQFARLCFSIELNTRLLQNPSLDAFTERNTIANTGLDHNLFRGLEGPRENT